MKHCLIASTLAFIVLATGINTQACTLAVTGISFGQFVVGDGNGSTATASITVNCQNGIPYNIGLDSGLNASRTMKNGAANLPYELYRDLIGNIWGDDGISVPSPSVAGVGNDMDQTHTVYGTLGGDLLLEGVYTDTITVTLDY